MGTQPSRQWELSSWFHHLSCFNNVFVNGDVAYENVPISLKNHSLGQRNYCRLRKQVLRVLLIFHLLLKILLQKTELNEKYPYCLCNRLQQEEQEAFK